MQGSVIGRDDSIRRLASSQASVSLVVGDSGVGKTTVLQAASIRCEGKKVLPPIVRVQASPGALQHALFDSLGQAVAIVTRDTSAVERAARIVEHVVERVAQVQLKGLARAVAQHLLGIVRAHAGEQVADTLQSVVAALSTTEADALAVRINGAADNDVVDLIVQFAGELLDLADGKGLVLTLDNADELADDDQRRLEDLARRLPRGVQIWAGFTLWNAESRNIADRLTEAGAISIPLDGLGVDYVAEYLISEGVAADLAPLVHGATGGYPLHLEDAVALLKESGSTAAPLAGLGPDGVMAARTRRAWRDLTVDVRGVATLLVAFSEPLPSKRIPAFLGIEAVTWGAIEASLRDQGLFTGSGRLWFHELRRRYIWAEILSQTERSEAADRALPYLIAAVRSGEQLPERLVQFFRIAQHSPAALATTNAQSVVDASRDEIAVLAAAFELIEPPARQAADADYCLLHAREVFRVTGDLRDALTSIVERGLVGSASKENVTVIVPFGSEESRLMLMGRAAVELRRVPMTAAASRLFEAALAPRLGAFRSGMYGVGWATLKELSDAGDRLQREWPDGTIHIGSKGPNLLIRASHGDLPFYASIAYDEAPERGEARESLTQLEQTVLGLPLRRLDVVDHPMPVVPSLRFTRAVERVLGRTRSLGRSRDPLDRLEAPISMDIEANWRVDLTGEVRARCSKLERYAYSLEETIGLLYGEVEDATALAEVLGGFDARRADGLLRWGDPLKRFSVSLEAGLPEGSRIGKITMTSGGPRDIDPGVDVVRSLRERAQAFNRSQSRVQIELSEASLAPLLSAAATRRWSDALALKKVISHGRDLPDPSGQTLYVLLERDKPDPRFVPGANATAVVIPVSNDIGKDEVFLRIVEDLPQNEWAAAKALIEQHFDVMLATPVTRLRRGVAQTILADLLDHDISEITFRNPEPEPVRTR
jgi:AAA ATPase domain